MVTMCQTTLGPEFGKTLKGFCILESEKDTDFFTLCPFLPKSNHSSDSHWAHKIQNSDGPHIKVWNLLYRLYMEKQCLRIMPVKTEKMKIIFLWNYWENLVIFGEWGSLASMHILSSLFLLFAFQALFVAARAVQPASCRNRRLFCQRDSWIWNLLLVLHKLSTVKKHLCVLVFLPVKFWFLNRSYYIFFVYWMTSRFCV